MPSSVPNEIEGRWGAHHDSTLRRRLARQVQTAQTTRARSVSALLEATSILSTSEHSPTTFYTSSWATSSPIYAAFVFARLLYVCCSDCTIVDTTIWYSPGPFPRDAHKHSRQDLPWFTPWQPLAASGSHQICVLTVTMTSFRHLSTNCETFVTSNSENAIQLRCYA